MNVPTSPSVESDLRKGKKKTIILRAAGAFKCFSLHGQR